MRLLQLSDLDDVMKLSRFAGWNQNASDWERLLHLEPSGCFAIEAACGVVATATAIRYETDLAWIGMVLTHPDWRGRGLASSLLSATLEYTADVRCRMLDATDAGRPIYQRLGFRDLCPIERWRCERSSGERVSAEPGEADLALDNQAFGTNRTALLASFGSPFSVPGAYAYARPGYQAHYLGPCVASTDEAAFSVIRSCLQSVPDEPWFWDLFPHNAVAARLAGTVGFTPVRQLFRMYLGTPPQQNVNLSYAIAGFELG